MSRNIITPMAAKLIMATALWDAIRRLPDDIDLSTVSQYELEDFEAENKVRLEFDVNDCISPCGVRISLEVEPCSDWATKDITPYIWHVALDCVVVGYDWLPTVETLSPRDVQISWAVAQAAVKAIEAMPRIAVEERSVQVNVPICDLSEMNPQ